MPTLFNCKSKTVLGQPKISFKTVCADEIGADLTCSDLGVLAEVVLVSVTGGARVVTHSGLISSPSKQIILLGNHVSKQHIFN
jgi:hypothetical protein